MCGGTAEPQKAGMLFHICVRTVLIHAVCSERTLILFCGCITVWFWAMSAQIRQSVREQADTGYWKIRMAYFPTIPDFDGRLV